MKLLLYCTKSKPNLNKLYGKNWFYFGEKLIDLDVRLNGKIVAQCNCEKVDLICPDFNYLDASCKDGKGFILYKACLTRKDLVDYGKGKYLYALHLSNLEVFNNSKDLSDFGIKIAPQNMRKCFDDKGNEYILISVHPEHLVNILEGKKTIEVRKKILKCMGGLGK